MKTMIKGEWHKPEVVSLAGSKSAAGANDGTQEVTKNNSGAESSTVREGPGLRGPS